MELFISKLIPTLVYPLGFTLFLLFVLTVLVWRKSRFALPVLLSAFTVLAIASLPVTSDFLAQGIENDYPAKPLEEYPQADVIIILGGAVNAGLRQGRMIELGEAADRVYYAALLYKLGKAQTIICSGGRLPWDNAAISEAEAMAEMLRNLGVEPESIIMEGGSANTRQNAINTAQKMAEWKFDKALLLTSASHMPRAMATFEKAGVSVTGVPVDYSALENPDRTLLDYLPDARALEKSTHIIKEYIGLLYYRLRGWV